MKITMENDDGVYTINEPDAVTITQILDIFERLLISAGFCIDRDSLEMVPKEKEKEDE